MEIGMTLLGQALSFAILIWFSMKFIWPPLTKAMDEEQVWRHLLPASLRWIADYECWVQEALGLEYRQRCLAQWAKAIVAAEEMPASWRHLADVFQKDLAR